MPYEAGDRVLINMRDLSPELIPALPWSALAGTVVENPFPGLYNVRLDTPIDGHETLMDLGEDRLMPHPDVEGDPPL
ncbi:MAG: hypothetical protein OXE50_03670 [Chloroflexi bacterium]|nr:hypothetical protein [Chloroflexota bacterium]